MRSPAVSFSPRSCSLSPLRIWSGSPLLVLVALACGETNGGPVDTTPTNTDIGGTVPPSDTTPAPSTPPSSTSTTQVNPPPPTGVQPTPVVPQRSNTDTGPSSSAPVQPTSAPSNTGEPNATTTGADSTTSDESSSGPTQPPPPNSFCPPDPGTAPSGTLNATLIDVTRTDPNAFILFEGPVWIDGALYFSEINPNPWDSHIRKYVPGAGDAEVFLANAGSNGLAVDANGVMHSATARKKEISKYDLAAKTQTTAVSGTFNSPNDIAIASNGTIYFSDQQQGELPAGGQPQVVRIVKDSQAAVFHPDIQPPNGVLLSIEEGILYVAITGNGVIKKVTLNEDGTADAVTDFATGLQTPDGMTKDCLGNIYVAEHNAQQVAVFSPEGTKIATIKTGMANNQSASPTNVAFGGADGKTLFITASYSLWSIDLGVAGYPY